MMPDNPIILNNPTATSPDREVEKEIILKENYDEELLKNLNSKNAQFILPDEVKKKKKRDA